MNNQTTQLRATSLNVTIVGTLFFIVFLGVLIHNGYQHYVIGIQDENHLDAQKKALLQTPDDTAMIREIRQKDLQTRSNKLHHLDTAAKGGAMLLICGVVTLFALRGRSELIGIAPVPAPDAKVPKQVRQQGWARGSVIVVVLVLVGLCIYAIQSLPLGFMTSTPTAAPIASEVTPTEQAIPTPTPAPVTASTPSYATPEELAQNWHRFRGYAGGGWTTRDNIPTAWDEDSGKGIQWKTTIPLAGHNSPVVWEDKVFLSGGDANDRHVYCFNAQNGKLLWTGEVPTVPVEEEHDIMEDTGYAASTLATDGVRIYAIFVTGDLAAFDFTGKRLWHKNLGFPENGYGHASSLEVWQDRVIVQYDQGYIEDQKSRMFAFDGATGEVAWEVQRPVGESWTSPVVASLGGGHQLLTIGSPWVISYDPNTGDEIWRAECVDGEVAASPVVAGDVILAVEPYAKTAGIRWDGKGNVTETHVLWENEDSGPEFVTPVSDGTHVILEDGGLLYCLSAKDGSLLWEHELEETSQASPSIVKDKLYVLAENGTMYVGTITDTALVDVTENKLTENCFASPAFGNECVYIRSEHSLYCIGTAGTTSQSAVVNNAIATPEQLQQNWHRFRGYAGGGVTSHTDIPTEWDGAEGKGILWKTEVPVSGHNSPIVWEDRIFLSGANEEKREVYCFDAKTGTIAWTGEVPTVPAEEEHDIMEDTGYAACTMATDGQRVYAIFVTGDLAAFDLTGKRLWHKNLGFPENGYGHASSLEVWQDRVIVQYDQGYIDDQKSKMFAFDGKNGDVVWEVKRPVGESWTTPAVASLGGGHQLLTIGSPWVISYDPGTGDEIWRAECVDGEVAASPVVAGKVILAVEPYAKTAGVRWDGKGNVTETHVLWENEDSGPEFVSPVSDGTRVILEDGGLLYCLSAQDGSLLWEHELEETSQASPSIAGNKLYVLAENGSMYVGTIGDEALSDVVENKLGENCFASPAFMPGRIYIRGENNLYCIGKE